MTHVNEPEHPGKIIFVDGLTQEVTKELSAAEVPFGILLRCFSKYARCLKSFG